MPKTECSAPTRLAREQPADVHVDPAILRAQGDVPGGRPEARLHRMLADTTDCLGHVGHLRFIADSRSW